jgi:hypothetical protein
MKCPACKSDVLSGQLACTRCGTLLPSLEEAPGHAAELSRWITEQQIESPNAKAEPLSIPARDVAERHRWDFPRGRHAAPSTDAMPLEPGPAAQDLGAPVTLPQPPEHDHGTQHATSPTADPEPLEPDPAAPDLNAPGPAPGPDPTPPGHDHQPTQNLETPGPGPMPPPGLHSGGRDQGVPPAAGGAAAFPADGRSAKNRKMLLVSAIAAIALFWSGLVYALTQGSPHKPHTAVKPGAEGPAQQAAAVDQILKSGKAARGHLPSRLKTCDDVSAGVPGFQQVVRDRQAELSQSIGLKVDQLQNGSRLQQSMTAAYQSSLTADEAYLAWAREVRARGCGGRIAPLTAHYRDALSANDKAGPAKRAVVALWKPIARSGGLPVYAWSSL